MNENVNARVKEIVVELRNIGLFVSVESIISILLDRYNVPSLQSLGIQSPTQIPNLQAIMNIQNRVNTFIYAFMSNSFRAIKTVSDLEMELVDALNSFGCSGILAAVNGARATDPNEIDIDVDSETSVINLKTKTNPLKFDEFGLGALEQHPAVVRAFGLLAGGCRTRPSTAEVLEHLVTYALADDRASFRVDRIDLRDFECYLLRQYGVASVGHLGIRLEGDLLPELALVAQVVASRKRHNLELKEMESKRLEKQRKEQQQSAERTAWVAAVEGKCSGPESAASARPGSIEMKPSSNSEVSRFLAECANRVDSLRRGSPYPPSFSQVLDIVKSTRGDGSAHTGSKKRLRGLAAAGEVEDSIIAEYVALHLCGKKYLQKRLVVVYKEQEVESIVGSDDAVNDDELTQTGCTSAESSSAMPTDPPAVRDYPVDSLVPDSNHDLSSQKALVDDRSMLFVDKAIVVQPTATAGPFQCRRQFSLSNSEKDATHSLLSSSQCWIKGNRFEFKSEDIRSVASLMSPLDQALDRRDSSQETLTATGLWGEALVFHLLTTSTALLGASVQWLNQKSESRAPYDLILQLPPRSAGHRATVVYIEVKATRFTDNNVFELSMQEWSFATNLPRVQYAIARVYCSGDISAARVVVVPDLLKSVEESEVKLLLGI